MSRGGSRLVYASGKGRMCPECGRPAASCRCRRSPTPREQPAAAAGRGGDPRDGVVRVRRETQGRGGKTVTSLSGVPLPEAGLRELAGELKRLCGCGGSAKGGVIEIQGDHRDAIVAELERRGFRVKRAGG
jgi:translation initiation factor 1